MTLAQNHLQRLSGNKKLGVILLLTFACISCGAFKSNTLEVEEYHKKEEETKVVVEKEPVKEVKIENEKKEEEVVALVEVYFNNVKYMAPALEDKSYTVALFLPFMANSTTSNLTSPMLDFLAGVETALKELEQKDIRINVKVYDTKNDVKTIQSILLKEELKNMDMIIGPVFDDHLKLMENHCAIYHIPLIVPLKYYGKETNTNFPLFNVFPTDSVFYYSLGKNVGSKYKNHKVFTITTKDKNSYFARKHFIKGYSEVNKKAIGNFNANNCNAACTGDSTLLFIPTTIESEMRTSLDLLKNKKKVTVLGLEEWQDFSVIDYPIWNMLNVHYGSKFYVNSQDSATKELRIKYRYNYSGEPTKYFYIAHDEMLFFGEALKAFGRSFPKYIKNSQFMYHHNAFYFVEKKGYFENESTNLIWFKDFSPVRVNH